MKLILTHENADFDAIAAELAAYKLDPDAVPVLPRKLNRNVQHFLALYRDRLPFVDPDSLKRGHVEYVTVVDTQSITTVRGMRPDTPIHFIDHHPPMRKMEPHWSFGGEVVGATTTLLAEQLQEQGVSLSRIEATLLLLGIYEDTGSLLYGTTTPRDLRCAAWLLEQGANLDVVHEFLHYPLSDAQRELYERLLESAEIHRIGGHVVVIATASAPDLVEEVSTLAHKLRDFFQPSAVFLLIRLRNHIQLVARSTSDAVDVSEVAAHFGGGGHCRAAAAIVRRDSLETARDEILELLPRVIRPVATVESIMSHGVQTVRADERISDVATRMRRTGHEGFPVLDSDGELVGLLTRRAVDKAMDHGLGGQTVETVMERGRVTVRPEDSVEHLRQLMIEHGWGQVPVVDGDGNLIGIVTRTDLIKLWGEGDGEATSRHEIVRKLEAALSPATMQLVRVISERAQEMGYGLYFVGGFVRDLLLGALADGGRSHDIDLVVEGDAISLARSLQRRYGGHTRSHRRFGTAKWLLDVGVWEQMGVRPDEGVPPFVDLVTARTEFYEHPSALPTVERGSIKLDLHRRDFTINTLAIRLAPGPFGQLLDFWGGERDLRRGLIRVLHSLSFVDDPTRMLRAVRFEQRLGFRIEGRTLELIELALPLLDRVSGARINHEIEAIMAEPEPEAALLRLDELGILRRIHPALRADEWLARAFKELRGAFAEPPWKSVSALAGRIEPGMAILVMRLSAEELESVAGRLRWSQRMVKIANGARELMAAMPKLEEAGARPSELSRLLDKYLDETLIAVWAASDERIVRERIAKYADRWRRMKPITDGRALKAMGLAPGPKFKRILNRLRDAWIDGEVTNEDEEKALLEALLEEL